MQRHSLRRRPSIRADAPFGPCLRPARTDGLGRPGGTDMTPYLSLVTWVPIFAGVAVLVLGSDRDAMKARWTALAGALAGFLVTIPLYTHFDATTSAMQFVEHREWIPYFDIFYHMVVDGISVLFI